eukprot:GHVR01168260.1.p1 GENE.GHVR01168260.1~~GHVR01168260.1.p1  ORF type:complete len:124 (+),score=7.91 GHVR01168260.1:1507-1878(+)
MVLNNFIEPKYYHKDGKRQIKSGETNLNNSIMKYYSTQSFVISDMMTKFKVVEAHPLIHFSDILKLNDFKIENHLWTLKYLGNLYLNLKLNGYLNYDHKGLKTMVLFSVIKYKVRVFRNIMIM